MKNKMQFRKRYEQGLTLIEASMVLALSAVVVAGVMLYYQSASDNNKLQNAQGEFGSLQTIVQGVYAGKNGYAGVNTNLTVGSSAIPPNLQDTATHMPLTPWQGDVALGNPTDQKGTAIAAAGAGDTSVYAIEFKKVPQGACTPLAAQVIGSSLIALRINGSPFYAGATGNYGITNGQVNVVGVAAACVADVAGVAQNDIVWTLK